jgi:hypothetical protein
MERVEEDGRVVHTLESASRASFSEVEQYQGRKGHKNLAGSQRKLSSKDQIDIAELLWAADSQTQRKSAGSKRDPSTDCCVRFHTKGLQMLTATSVRRVLGGPSANAQIKRVCIRHGICPPCEARWLTHDYHAAVEKVPTTRRAMSRFSVAIRSFATLLLGSSSRSAYYC